MEFVLDAHCHTTASGHAYSTVKEYAEEAAAKGLSLVAITDHAPKMPGSTTFLYFWNMRVIPKIINGVEIMSGVELNILDADGKVDLGERTLKDLDVVIASLHTPCVEPMSYEDNTASILNVMKNPFVRIIGHPGDSRYPMDIDRVVKAAGDYGVAMEINNASLDPWGSRYDGGGTIKEIMSLCVKYQVPMILGSDAHIAFDVGDFGHVKDWVTEMNIPESLILNTSTEAFKAFLARVSK